MKMIPSTRRSQALLALGIFVMCALLWWWQIAGSATSRIPGLGGDPFQTLWRFVRLGDVLQNGSLTIPEEHALRNLGPLPWMPLHALAGEVVTYGAAWLVSAVLSGWCTFLLARAWGARFLPALVAGLLVQFSPYRLSQALGHFGAMQLWWIPATLLALTTWARTRHSWWGIASAALVVGTAWTEHQLFVSLLLLCVIVMIVEWKRVLALVRATPRSVALAGVLVILGAVLPFLSTIRSVSSAESFLNLGQEERARFSATPETLFLPPPFHLFRQGLQGYGTDTAIAADHVHTVGIVALAALLFTFAGRSARRMSRRDAALLAIAVLGVVLALGPLLRIGSVTFPLPGALLDRLPVLSAIRTVGRFVVLPVILLPVLLAVRWPARSHPLSLGLAALLLLEVVPALGYPTMAVGSPAVTAAIKTLPPGTLLVIPAYTNYRLGSEHLYFSARDAHAVVGNSALERATDPATQRRFLETPVLRDLALLRLEDLKRPTFFGQDLADVAPAAIASQRVVGVVFHANPPGGVVSLEQDERHALSNEEKEAVRSFLKRTLGLVEERVADNVYLYRVPAPSASTPAVALHGAGWTLLFRDDARLRARLADTADMSVFAPHPVSSPLTLLLHVVERGEATTMVVDTPRGSTTVSLPEDDADIRLPLGSLEGGFSTYTFRLDGPGLIVENPRILVPR